MTVVLVIFAVYLGSVAALAVAARPQRREAVAIHAHLMKLDLLPHEVALINHTLASAYSMRTPIMATLSYMQGLVMSRAQLDAEADQFVVDHPNLINRAELYRLFRLANSCAASLSPLFGILAITSRWLFLARATFQLPSGSEITRFLEVRTLAVAA